MRCGKRRPPSSRPRRRSALEQLVDQLAQQRLIELSAVDALDGTITTYERCHRHALSFQQRIEICMAGVRQQRVSDPQLASKSESIGRIVLAVHADYGRPSGVVMRRPLKCRHLAEARRAPRGKQFAHHQYSVPVGKPPGSGPVEPSELEGGCSWSAGGPEG